MDTEQQHFLETFPLSWWGLKGTHYEIEKKNYS